MSNRFLSISTFFRTSFLFFLLLFSISAFSAENSASSSPTLLQMEINKTEQRDGLCVVYMKLRNHTGKEFSELKAEMFAFDKNELVSAHFLVDFQKILADKTIIKLIPLKDEQCNQLGSILLNQMSACKTTDGDFPNCMQQVKTTSKTKIELFK